MPQITVEYSANLELGNVEAMVLAMHQILAEHLPTELGSCKTRIIKHDHYLIGEGSLNGAFLHAEIRIMAGRTQEVISRTSRAVLELLENHLAKCANECEWQISVAISDLPSSYLKSAKA